MIFIGILNSKQIMIGILNSKQIVPTFLFSFELRTCLNEYVTLKNPKFRKSKSIRSPLLYPCRKSQYMSLFVLLIIENCAQFLSTHCQLRKDQKLLLNIFNRFYYENKLCIWTLQLKTFWPNWQKLQKEVNEKKVWHFFYIHQYFDEMWHLTSKLRISSLETIVLSYASLPENHSTNISTNQN